MHSMCLTRPWASTLKLPKTGGKNTVLHWKSKSTWGLHEHREAAMISMGVGGTYLEPHAWGLGAKTH